MFERIPLAKSRFTIRAQIIWAKERLVMSQGDYHWQHEPCWYAVRKKGHWVGDRKQTTLCRKPLAVINPTHWSERSPTGKSVRKSVQSFERKYFA